MPLKIPCIFNNSSNVTFYCVVPNSWWFHSLDFTFYHGDRSRNLSVSSMLSTAIQQQFNSLLWQYYHYSRDIPVTSLPKSNVCLSDSLGNIPNISIQLCYDDKLDLWQTPTSPKPIRPSRRVFDVVPTFWPDYPIMCMHVYFWPYISFIFYHFWSAIVRIVRSARSLIWFPRRNVRV